MTADDTRGALIRFCAENRCESCPVNTWELGMDEADPCVVSLAIDALPEEAAP